MFAYLERAVRAGYDDWDELNANPALDPFRERPEFARLRAVADEP